MTGETAAGQGPTSSADRRMAQDRYRAPRRPHRMVHALRTRWLREIREMRCRLASGCQRTSAGSSARPVKGSFAVADAMAQATLDRPALPGGFRQLSDEASPRLSWQPGDRTWHRPASPAHSPGQTNPHARHTRASRSWTPIGASARACPRHAVAALDGITGAHVDWTDSRGLNQWERTALELVRGTEQTRIRHQHYQGPRVTNGSTVQTERLWYPDRTTLVPLRGRGVTLSEMPGQRGG